MVDTVYDIMVTSEAIGVGAVTGEGNGKIYAGSRSEDGKCNLVPCIGFKTLKPRDTCSPALFVSNKLTYWLKKK